MRAHLLGAITVVLAAGCGPAELEEQCTSSCEETACGAEIVCSDFCDALYQAAEDTDCVTQMQATYDCFDAAVDAADEVCAPEGAVVYDACADELDAFYACLGQQP